MSYAERDITAPYTPEAMPMGWSVEDANGARLAKLPGGWSYVDENGEAFQLTEAEALDVMTNVFPAE